MQRLWTLAEKYNHWEELKKKSWCLDLKPDQWESLGVGPWCQNFLKSFLGDWGAAKVGNSAKNSQVLVSPEFFMETPLASRSFSWRVTVLWGILRCGFSFPVSTEASRWQLQGQVACKARKEQSGCSFLVSVALSYAYGVLLMHSALLNSKQEPAELFNT